MQEDFFNELGELALGSRLKRLSDRLSSQALSIYERYNLPIQPKWFPLLALLQKRKVTSVVEASEALRLSQPALSQFIQQLHSVGLVEYETDSKDSRRKLIQLSKKGIVIVSNMQPVWQLVKDAAIELSVQGESDFYRALVEFEKAFNKVDLKERVDALTRNIDQQAVTFAEFTDDNAIYFDVINREWVADMFALEPIDERVLSNPKEEIIDKGGRIFFASTPLHGTVGACALMQIAPGSYELTKMGVLSSARGLKIGEKLLAHVLSEASEMKIDELFLLTNAKCEAAIHLYEKLGFEHSENIMRKYGSEYERCNVAMIYAASK